MPKGGAAQQARAAQSKFDKQRMLERIALRKPLIDAHVVVLDEGPLTAVQQKQHEVDIQELTDKNAPKYAELSAELEQLKAAAEDAIEVIYLREIPRDDYEALMLAHEPTEAQQARGLATNMDEFMPALIAACSWAPEAFDDNGVPDTAGGEQPLFSAEEVKAMVAPWPQGEQNALWTKANGVCQRTRNASIPKGSGMTRG